MTNRKYECLVRCPGRSLTVSVITPSKNKQVIRKLAVDRAVDFLDEMGSTYERRDIVPIGYKNRGKWPTF